ncbi:DUF1552 domain-containing protein [Sandaracinus amylolyticus]|uniref:DUF1552 domain-containing protein n=1 Tax=Sandaracinus amylolyticus TaxID=927083 RepID=UPI001F3E218A|nr:DUF1552 domain-containing protein [Sandaracinus amylolyticus]UJR85449.1 Hypothetical protein I5071_75290 [Sandaracinus amylolyticus]
MSRFSRRVFLAGAGVTLALPWMESLSGRARAQTTAPKRFLAIYFPNGAAAQYWPSRGAGSGDSWQLSPILEPLAPLKAKTTVLTNLENYTAMQGDPFVEPSHARCTGAFLTCADSDALRDELGVEVANGISIDQVIARSDLGRLTPIPSLQVGLSTLNSFTDGRHGSLSRSVSWASETEPLYKDVNPQSVFDRLIAAGAGDGGLDPEAQAAATRRRMLRRSALDYLGDATTRVQQRLSVADRAALDQYLTSVRELERRVASIGDGVTRAMCEPVERHGEAYGVDAVPADYDRGEHADVMNDLVTMALQCDSTRVISYMLDDARSDFVYSHLTNRTFSDTGSVAGSGSVGGYHGLQHAGDSNDGYATINWWLTQKVADLCQRLDAIPEGEGTVLDNTVVVFGSGMHGSNHDANELPIVLIGGGGGTLRGDQHIVFPATPGDRPLRDLYYTLLTQTFELPVTSFGSHVGGIPNQLVAEILR